MSEIPDTDDFWVQIQGATIESHFDVSAYLNARDDWFKRCIEDFPKGAWMKLAGFSEGIGSEHYFKGSVDHWLNKWFSQFKGNSDRK